MSVFTYVESYIIFIDKYDASKNNENIVDGFEKEGIGLKFTFKLPSNNRLQFLDVCMNFGADHVC